MVENEITTTFVSEFTRVLREADAPAWVGGYASYIINTQPGWRPSDAARQAVRDWQSGRMTEARHEAELAKDREISRRTIEINWLGR